MSRKEKDIFYPPGGILIWIVILIELITFGIAITALAISSKQEPELFHLSRLQLNTTYGVLNTLILLTSGFFMAQTMQLFKSGQYQKSTGKLKLTMVLGVLFLVIKSIEYYSKIEAGLGINENTFFTFYWLLTLFHLIHVVIGIGILLFIWRDISQKEGNASLEDLEAGAAFWHMCDLIWLILFPIIYLIF